MSDKLKAACLSFAEPPTLNYSFFQTPWFMWLQGKRWHFWAVGSEARKGGSQKTWYPLTFRLQLFIWREIQSREQNIYPFSSLETWYVWHKKGRVFILIKKVVDTVAMETPLPSLSSVLVLHKSLPFSGWALCWDLHLLRNPCDQGSHNQSRRETLLEDIPKPGKHTHSLWQQLSLYNFSGSTRLTWTLWTRVTPASHCTDSHSAR